MKYLNLFLICFALGCATTGVVAGKPTKLVPYYSEINKKIEGIRFVYIKKGSIFEEMGFEKGDVIKKVNGESITNPVRAFELFKGLKGKAEF